MRGRQPQNPQAMPMYREFTMSFTPPPAAAGPRRRTLFTGAAGALGVLGITTGCSDGAAADGTAPDEDSPAARRIRTSAADLRRALLAEYDGTADAHPALGGRLKPLRAAVARQAEALEGSGSSRGAAPAREQDVPAGEKAALAALAKAERQAADAHTAALTDAPPQLARLLASIAAAGAAHAYLLGKEEA
jgi:hypothetical protein